MHSAGSRATTSSSPQAPTKQSGWLNNEENAMTLPNVPLVDLSHQQAQINDTIREGFNRVIAESSYISGPQVEEFEEAWSHYCGVPFAMGVGNGTDAIEIG